MLNSLQENRYDSGKSGVIDSVIEGADKCLNSTCMHAVAALEVGGPVDGPNLEATLRKLSWPDPLNDEAQYVMAERCDLFTAARNARQSQ